MAFQAKAAAIFAPCHRRMDPRIVDWLLFSSNALTALTATPIVMFIGFVLGSVGGYLIQRKGAKDGPWSAVLKALLAGIVVGLPWPLGGTLIGGWVLLYSGLGNAREEVLGG